MTRTKMSQISVQRVLEVVGDFDQTGGASLGLVAWELAVDEELLVEGWAREIVHVVQSARRNAGLEIADRIVLKLHGDQALLEAAHKHEPYIAGETLTVEVGYGGSPSGEPSRIDGRELWVEVARADRAPTA